ncbi:MAG: alkaline phosphatase family protein [Planctomycetes bacterium]|nr:alkaline phosphatase family protein [Planctomycetota bacterium]
MIFGFGSKKKVFGIGLDGFPHSLATRLMEEGHMPNLQRLAAEGTFREINSVYPTVSNVAWGCWQTGVSPAELGVFGFVELDSDLSLRIPNARDMKATTIWEKMTEEKRPIVSLSVPMTWPAPEVEGLLVSGFLAPKLDERAVSSPEVLRKLRWTMYEIDTDPALAHQSLDDFQEAHEQVSTRRQTTALELMESEEWDLFFVHVMDTDRINHFIWKYQHEPESPRGRYFYEFYEQVDDFIGRVAEKLDDETELLIHSDHGFCDLKWEVQLNRWLREQGYLELEDEIDPRNPFQSIKPDSRAFSLVPGRIYILTKNRWETGQVSDVQYEGLREEIAGKLESFAHPESGESVCRKIMTREEAFKGRYSHLAPDLLVDPQNGYDLKAKLGDGPVFEREVLNGMHTYDDAMLVASEGLENTAKSENVREVGANLARYLLG